MHKYKLITEADILSMLIKNQDDIVLNNNIRASRDNNYNPYPNGWNRHDMYRDMFSDMRLDGYIMHYPHGRVIKQADRTFHYRGENQIHKSSQATLHRKLKCIKNQEERLVEEVISFIRIVEFLDLILKLKHTQDYLSLGLSCKNTSIQLDLLYEQIAQHYGLNTPWLDFTSDFEVALFFACCKLDNKTRKWEPLTNKDFNQKEDTKYGVIFRRTSNHPNNIFFEKLQSLFILPNGYQPFMRCHMQNSYVAKTNIHYSLQEDRSFEKMYFKHSERLCDFIYNRMDGGNKIYPHEGLSLMSDEIESIKNRSAFSLESFNFTFEENEDKFPNKERVRNLLNKYGYEIVNASNYFSKKKIESINKEYEGFDIEETYNIRLRTRMTSVL